MCLWLLRPTVAFCYQERQRCSRDSYTMEQVSSACFEGWFLQFPSRQFCGRYSPVRSCSSFQLFPDANQASLNVAGAGASDIAGEGNSKSRSHRSGCQTVLSVIFSPFLSAPGRDVSGVVFYRLPRNGWHQWRRQPFLPGLMWIKRPPHDGVPSCFLILRR